MKSRTALTLAALVSAHIRGSTDRQQEHGLYTEDSIRNVYVGTPLIEVDLVAGRATLDVQLEWCDNLREGVWHLWDVGGPDWTRTDTGWQHEIPSAPYRCFYRVFAGDRQ